MIDALERAEADSSIRVVLFHGDGDSFTAGNQQNAAIHIYSITINQAAFRVVNRYVGNLPPLPGIFPDYPAPVARNPGGEREMTMMRWGMPPHRALWATGHEHPQHVLAALARLAQAGNSFAEYAPEPNPETKKKDIVWFGLGDDRPLATFVGIWTEYKGDRGTESKPIPGAASCVRLLDPPHQTRSSRRSIPKRCR